MSTDVELHQRDLGDPVIPPSVAVMGGPGCAARQRGPSDRPDQQAASTLSAHSKACWDTVYISIMEERYPLHPRGAT